MTTKEAARRLPKWAKGLYNATLHHTVAALRDTVLQELEMCQAGENPLTEKQVRELKNFLAKVQP